MRAILAVGVIAFVLTGASSQTAAITALHDRAQSEQLTDITMRAIFLDSQRALGGYQATRANRFLQTYYLDQDQFILFLARLRGMAWSALLPGVTAQADAAQAAFAAGDRAIAAPASSAQAPRSSAGHPMPPTPFCGGALTCNGSLPCRATRWPCKASARSAWATP